MKERNQNHENIIILIEFGLTFSFFIHLLKDFYRWSVPCAVAIITSLVPTFAALIVAFSFVTSLRGPLVVALSPLPPSTPALRGRARGGGRAGVGPTAGSRPIGAGSAA